ncbi:LAMI_0A08064g1_1 [Lachancea mirantina]|uniref:LAMI_0A08064g1_1 n=1 Tax=Lachancea mirantina TaxID=1230905 RepID=A0A1G4IR39_9SACH|nr:LAMI_0A08064g1_1 [Lachancea mirantina]
MGKTYFIAGGTRGIGLALVKELSEQSEGNLVFTSARNPDQASELSEWTESHKNVQVVSLDVTDAASVKASATRVRTLAPGGIDVLVVNAGVGSSSALLQTSDSEYHRVFDTNTLGPIRVIEAFLPLLREGETRHIAVISSIAGSIQICFPEVTPAYAISKLAVNFYVRNLSTTLKNEGFSVLAIHPGVVGTDLFFDTVNAMGPEIAKAIQEKYPPITPKASASQIIENILAKQGPTFTDRFVSYDGSEIPW